MPMGGCFVTAIPWWNPKFRVKPKMPEHCFSLIQLTCTKTFGLSKASIVLGPRNDNVPSSRAVTIIADV
jgi:hypothetical protein